VIFLAVRFLTALLSVFRDVPRAPVRALPLPAVRVPDRLLAVDSDDAVLFPGIPWSCVRSVSACNENDYIQSGARVSIQMHWP
jgi:hypothetical protein